VVGLLICTIKQLRFVTSSFVVAGIGALYILSKRNEDYGKMFLKTELFWLISSLIVAVPTGDLLAKNVVSTNR
jgi:cytochrome d ubiquinol oxidase subunit I